MGKGLLDFFKNKIKKEYKIAFFITFAITLLIHIYKFTNTLPNHDSVYNYYSNLNILGSGRWALSIFCGFSSYYDLPWIIGMLSCIFISLSVVFIVAIFEIHNPVLIALTGGLIASSPAITETFFFLYTADGYMIAMFLATLAVYFSKFEEMRNSRLLLSILCVSVSCGIYQAYVSFSLVLAICYFIDILLQNKYSKENCFKWIIKQAFLYIIGLFLYYIIWKICLHFTGTPINDYQGINTVGKINLHLLISGIIRTIWAIVYYFFQWNVFKYGFSLYAILNIIFLVAMVFGIIIASKKSEIYKKNWALVLLCISLCAIIPFACMWNFTSTGVFYRAMMLQSFTIIFILTAVVYERWANSYYKNIICILLILIVFNNALMANISYFYMNLCYERTYAEGVEMILRIHELQDKSEFDKIAIIGSRDVSYDFLNSKRNSVGKPSSIYILSSNLENSLLFESDHTINFLKATFGLNLKDTSYKQRYKLSQTDMVKEMECWPSKNSMLVVGDTLIIKYSNVKKVK